LSTYRDDGISGATADNRPGLQAALKHAAKTKSILIVYSLSRLARNTKETIEIGEKLRKARANLCSVTEKIDTSTAMGAAFFQIIAVLAELERKQISERTSDAMLRHQANGRRMGSVHPFGWKSDPENPARMVPDENEQAAIKTIHTLRKQGLGYCAIASKLKELGFQPRPLEKIFKDRVVQIKGKWHFGLIRNIIKRNKNK